MPGIRENEWTGPLLPGEVRPLYVTPASSEPSEPPPMSEAECIRCLVRHHRWCHLGDNKLMRWNPHGRAIAAEVEALGDE